jgi:hypothetical protein
MWSLPNIQVMNASAHATVKPLRRKLSRFRKHKERIECDRCGEPATWAEEFFDIFSEDPKGIFALCDKHRDYLGEDYFECGYCDRLMISNYTWEVYYHDDEHLGRICLPCYARITIDNPLNWIELTEENIEALTFEDLRKARHLIGVSMPIPEGLRFVSSAEFDSMGGGSVAGGGLGGLKEALRDLQAIGVERAILILDAAYQFAVSVGVYVDDPQE